MLLYLISHPDCIRVCVRVSSDTLTFLFFFFFFFFFFFLGIWPLCLTHAI